MEKKLGAIVDSSIGRLNLDSGGAAVAAVRMSAQESYLDTPLLLQRYIDDSDTAAWDELKAKIDYTYLNLDYALGKLNEETSFGSKVHAWIKENRRLLFKVNLVQPACMNPMDHSEDVGYDACTGWPFIAALMRWFHDKLGVTYHQMMLGEAGTAVSRTAAFYTITYGGGRKITPEAIMEGKIGDFYGGWGFYFARKYLAETHPSNHRDNPMLGYEESLNGTYLPPGRAGDRLMAYDLNRIYDLKEKRRDVPLPDGVNFKEITLHKVVTGGDPENPDDMRDYPGCVLVNVPRLKVHSQTMFTNAFKNLGIGLYPMQAAADDDPQNTHWKYSFPFHNPPSLKAELPHMPWVAELDENNLPVRDKNGDYVVTKTAGLVGTMVDIVKAVANVKVPMLHVVDAIFTVNINHAGVAQGVKVPEGYAFASLDVLALDNLCSRYLFNNVAMAEAREQNLGTDFMQRVPLVESDGQNLVGVDGFDAPLARYDLFDRAEERGLGNREYHVIGRDIIANTPLASLQGHLGQVNEGRFSELLTSALYYANGKPLWDIQKTVLSYAQANDNLTGSSYHEQLMAAFDENGDGVIDYEEVGKKGFWHAAQRLSGYGLYLRLIEKYGFLHGDFVLASRLLRYSNLSWNNQGHDFLLEYRLACLPALAYKMAQATKESQDKLFPEITWGRGKWPSLQFTSYSAVINTLYGSGLPQRIDLSSLYGLAFQYADKVQNHGNYCGDLGLVSRAAAASNYVKAVVKGAPALDFIIFVPQGYGSPGMPNVKETTDPAKVFTASFNGGREFWQ